MTTDPPDEGQLVFELLYGSGERQRLDAPEPSVLPHLAAYLCHDFSIEEVLEVAFEFGHFERAAPAWPALWYATLWAAGSRPDLIKHLRQFSGMPPVMLDLAELGNRPDAEQASERFAEVSHTPGELGSEFSPDAAAAQLLVHLAPAQIEQVIDEPRFRPNSLDAGSLRALLLAMQRIDRTPDAAWLDAALDAPDAAFDRFGRLSLLVPDLPDTARARYADELAGMACNPQLPPYYRALMVSRAAPFVSAQRVFRRDTLFDDLPEIWAAHIDQLLRAPWPGASWGDVFRAHPEADAFAKVRRPHETTAGTPRDILGNWGAQAAMASPSDRGGPPTDPADEISPDPEAGRSPPSDTPRALQADVSRADDMEAVSAFVAGEEHLIDISIGRGARIRADVAIDEGALDFADNKTLKLPVFLRVAGTTHQGLLRLPRDQSRNSTTASFTVTAPDRGRFTARIHVMRPDGGTLLQSAMLIGDVVDTLARAQSPDTPIELQVDVLAGDLRDPLVNAGGAAIITDAEQSQVASGGSLIDVDVAQLQEKLGKLVEQIELAADRRDVDDTIIERKLVELAMAGQGLRALLDAPLEALRDQSTLQVVSLRPGDVLPLELIYDGPGLALQSTICSNWRAALKAGSCEGCPGHGPDADTAPRRMCPMRFWSMHKVIERRTADLSGGEFRVGSEPSQARPHLSAVKSVVVGASGRVAPDHVRDLCDHVASALGVPTRQVADWAQWRDAIAASSPEVLLAMPHDQPIASHLSSALMMGEPEEVADAPPDTALLAGSVTVDEVRSGDARPGPVVMLLGCNTLFMEGRLTNFASEFHHHGAALTIATLGKLVVDQAPMAARAIVDLLAKPPTGATTLGEVLLQARRNLLGDNMIMALLLVANGDAQWQLPTTDGIQSRGEN